MASPLAHSLVGLGVGAAYFLPRATALRDLATAAWRLRSTLAGCILLSNAPDIDYLFGLPNGNLNQNHQYATHTLVWVMVLVLGVWLIWRRRAPGHGWAQLILLSTLGLGHLGIDLLTEDSRAPFGLLIFWPFSDQRVYLPEWTIFWGLRKSTWASVFSWQNVAAGARELALTLPLPLWVLWYKLRRSSSL